MRIKQEYIERIESAENSCDILSEIVEILCKKIQNESQFLIAFKEVFDNNQNLKVFVGNVQILFENRELICSSLVQKLMNLFDELVFETNQEFFSDDLFVLYAVVKGIDNAAKTWNDSEEGAYGPKDDEGGVLNHRFRVYMRPQASDTLLADYENDETGIGRDRANSYHIVNSTERFMFLDSNLWSLVTKTAGIPQCVLVDCKPEVDKVLRVGVSMLCDRGNFVFDDIRCRRRVQYCDDGVQYEYADSVEKSINKAIEEKCHIFVLPEYGTSPIILERVKQTLKKASSEGLAPPFLTFAGSTWTSDNNNVMEVINSRGIRIGKYYKHSPFRMPNENPQIIEDLNDPGKESCFFMIPRVGVILPSICRDAIDEEYTRMLVSCFTPLLAVVSAYSPSINSFDERMGILANAFFTSSIVNNYCQARSDKPVGRAYIVHQNETVAGWLTTDIDKLSACPRCDEGCLRVCEFNFEFKKDSQSKKLFSNTSLEVNH